MQLSRVPWLIHGKVCGTRIELGSARDRLWNRPCASRSWEGHESASSFPRMPRVEDVLESVVVEEAELAQYKTAACPCEKWACVRCCGLE